VAPIAAIVLVVAFGVLSIIHVYWALGGRGGKLAAVPEVGGRPAFMPTTRATFFVAIALALFALLVAATARLIATPVPAAWLSGLSYILALALLARAVGDFRLVGFLKRVRGTRFARLDTLVYSPLCLILGLGVAVVAYTHGA
jgi:hypothetical protein